MANPLFEKEELESGAGGKEQPAEFKGKSADELIAMIQQRDEELKAVTKRSEDVLQEIGKLRAELTPQTKPDEPKKEEQLDWYNKPAEAAAAVAGQLYDAKMRPLVQTYFANEELRQIEEVMRLPYATEYADEIKQLIASARPEDRIKAGFARGAYDFVKGRHLDDIVKKEIEKKGRAPEFTETQTQGAARQAERVNPLSPEEQRVADAYGMSAEKYRLWQKTNSVEDAKTAQQQQGGK